MTPASSKKGIALGLCLLVSTWMLYAVTPKFWELFSQEDLIKGRLRGVSLDSDGKLILAPQYESIFKTDKSLIFSMTAGPASDIYLGTGHEGIVYKVATNGTGEEFFKAKEIDVFALACDTMGNVFVGSSPNGKVYKVAANGSETEFFDPRSKYIWDLKFDTEGNLYVATGGKGLIFRVDPSGNATTLFDSDETHIMALTFDLDGNVIAGTAPGGLIYRISKKGKAFVLLDSPLAEIRQLGIDRLGDLFALALASDNGPDTGSLGLSSTTPATTGSIVGTGGNATIITDTTVSAATQNISLLTSGLGSRSARDKTSSKSILYRITKRGTTEEVWSSKTDMVFDFLVRDDGKVLLGTGTKGRILAVDAQKSYTILTESESEQVTRLIAVGHDIFASTSNMGSLYKLQPVGARTGEYESDVFDAGMPSDWGQISWKSNLSTGTTIEVFTRSGNTKIPNKTWSDWTGPYGNNGGESINSPLARYLQWKVVFKSGGASRKLITSEDSLQNVVIAYLQQNVRPRLTSINILPPGVALQKPPSLPSSSGTVTVSRITGTDSSSVASSAGRINRFNPPPRRILKPGSRAFTWKATDENQDDLVYEVSFKGESESNWKLLKKGLKDDFLTIENNTMPDGLYTIRVVASDAPTNAYGQSLAGETISRPFVINNTAPTIEVVSNETKGKQVEVRYRAQDSASRIFSSEFSLDGGAWHLVFPQDGIADSHNEEFVFTTPELTSGEHMVALRVTDTVGNVGMFKLIIKIP